MVAATMRSDFPGEIQTHPALANVDNATATIDEEGSLRFWALTAGGAEPRPGDTADGVLAAAYSPDGQFLVTGDDEGDGCCFQQYFVTNF